MRDSQLDFFQEETVILGYDEDDPPPKESYSDLHWWFLNRWAEWGMRSARLLGIM